MQGIWRSSFAALCFLPAPHFGDAFSGREIPSRLQSRVRRIWLKPEAVAQIAFLEWTGADHLRHTKFVAPRDDKDPKRIVRET
jgi:ATP-dependent DNA ligase